MQDESIIVENTESGCANPTSNDINCIDSTPHARGNAANQAGSFFSPLPEATTFEQQLSKLKERGLAVDDDDFALACLQDFNYYRLRGYWLTLEENGAFRDGVSFSDIWDIYQLDRELRGWLWRSIAPIEIKLRTQLAYHFAHLCDPAAYLEAENFRSANMHRTSIANYERERSKAYNQRVPYVVHNFDRYGKLPVWAAVEIMSFGTLSKLYGNLDPNAGKTEESPSIADAVARAFGASRHHLKSWVRHLATVRNIVAHHDRFYNRIMHIQAEMLNCDASYANNKQFPTFLVIKRIYERSWPDEWKSRVKELCACFDAHPGVDLAPMGFPSNWKDVLELQLETNLSASAI